VAADVRYGSGIAVWLLQELQHKLWCKLAVQVRVDAAGSAAWKGGLCYWGGSGFVVRLLKELQQKLWCKLAAQVGVMTL
jgi:hypothetical protein